MKNSTIKGKNYLVWEKDSSHITKVNKKKTDKVVSNCIKALSYLADTLEELEQSDRELWYLISDESPCYNEYEFIDLCNRYSTNLMGLLIGLKTNNDKIPETHITLEDLGYKKMPFGREEYTIYEKIIEDTDEKEVVEEIVLTDDDIRRRKRVTFWEKNNHGKQSTSIKYTSLKLTKKIIEAIENTKH